MSLKALQEQIVENKRKHGFNVTSMEQEFCYLYGEVSEAYEAYYKKKDTFPEELADVAIFLLGIAELNGVDLETEIVKKVTKNKERSYKFNDLGKPVHD